MNKQTIWKKINISFINQCTTDTFQFCILRNKWNFNDRIIYSDIFTATRLNNFNRIFTSRSIFLNKLGRHLNFKIIICSTDSYFIVRLKYAVLCFSWFLQYCLSIVTWVGSFRIIKRIKNTFWSNVNLKSASSANFLICEWFLHRNKWTHAKKQLQNCF